MSVASNTPFHPFTLSPFNPFTLSPLNLFNEKLLLKPNPWPVHPFWSALSAGNHHTDFGTAWKSKQLLHALTVHTFHGAGIKTIRRHRQHEVLTSQSG